MPSQSVKRGPGRPRKGVADSKSDSAITKHLHDSPSCLGVVGKDLKRYFKILSRARHADHLHTIEAVFIAFRKPNLCNTIYLLDLSIVEDVKSMI